MIVAFTFKLLKERECSIRNNQKRVQRSPLIDHFERFAHFLIWSFVTPIVSQMVFRHPQNTQALKFRISKLVEIFAGQVEPMPPLHKATKKYVLNWDFVTSRFSQMGPRPTPSFLVS